MGRDRQSKKESEYKKPPRQSWGVGELLIQHKQKGEMGNKGSKERGQKTKARIKCPLGAP
jgi:hypothetical protein